MLFLSLLWALVWLSYMAFSTSQITAYWFEETVTWSSPSTPSCQSCSNWTCDNFQLWKRSCSCVAPPPGSTWADNNAMTLFRINNDQDVINQVVVCSPLPLSLLHCPGSHNTNLACLERYTLHCREVIRSYLHIYRVDGRSKAALYSPPPT